MAGEKLTLAPGDTLINQGDPSTDMFLIMSGDLKVLVKQKDGTEHHVGDIPKGEVVGEMAFLDKKPRSASIKATTECQVIKIPLDKAEEYLESLPDWFRSLQTAILQRLRDSDKKA